LRKSRGQAPRWQTTEVAINPRQDKQKELQLNRLGPRVLRPSSSINHLLPTTNYHLPSWSSWSSWVRIAQQNVNYLNVRLGQSHLAELDFHLKIPCPAKWVKTIGSPADCLSVTLTNFGKSPCGKQ